MKITNLLPLNKPIWVVAGAGVSFAPPASIPLWGQIKADTIDRALSILAQVVNTSARDSQEILKTLLGVQNTLLDFPEEAMEDLCLAYGEEPSSRTLISILGNSTLFHPAPTAAHLSIANLALTQHIHGIITTNFDTLFEDALTSVRMDFQKLLSGAFPLRPVPLPVLKVHGSVDASRSMRFRRSAYYSGLPDSFASYIRESIRECYVLILGYSGYDSDLFPLIRDDLTEKSARNMIVIVNPTLPVKDSPLDSLLKFSNVEYVKSTADEFFDGKNVSTARLPQKASLVPTKNIESAIAFLALVARRKQPRIAHHLFRLLQNFANDSDEILWGAIAHLGKALCTTNLADVFNECLIGCSFVEKLRKTDALSEEQVQLFFDWQVIAMWQLTRYVLAAMMKSQQPQGRDLRRVTTIWADIRNELIAWKPIVEASASWQFASAVVILLHAMTYYLRQPIYAIPGILEVISSSRTNGNYELELDAIELLNHSIGKESRHQFDFDSRYKRICEISNASKSRQNLMQLGVANPQK